MNKKDREKIFDKYGGKCAYCGCELPKVWHADHIEPIVRNSKWNRDKGRFEQTGTCEKPENETLENRNPACASCNIQKSSFTVEQFRSNIKMFVNLCRLDEVFVYKIKLSKCIIFGSVNKI